MLPPPADPVIIINPDPELIVMFGPARICNDPLYPFALLTYLPSDIEFTDAVNDAVKPFSDCVSELTEALKVFNALISVGAAPAEPVIIMNPDPLLTVIFGPARIKSDPLYSFTFETYLPSLIEFTDDVNEAVKPFID